jgi:hypothetical protein
MFLKLTCRLTRLSQDIRAKRGFAARRIALHGAIIRHELESHPAGLKVHRIFQ